MTASGVSNIFLMNATAGKRIAKTDKFIVLNKVLKIFYFHIYLIMASTEVL